MKKLRPLLIITLLLIPLLTFGCDLPPDQKSTDDKVAAQTEQMMTESNKVVGMPNITNWQEKELVKQLYELRDQEGFQTYTYIIDMNGNKHFLGRSIGYGIPASVQFSNPQRQYEESRMDRGATFIAQPEPNGLFMPEGLSATYVFLLDGNGTPRPVYVEPEIMVSPFKMH